MEPEEGVRVTSRQLSGQLFPFPSWPDLSKPTRRSCSMFAKKKKTPSRLPFSTLLQLNTDCAHAVGGPMNARSRSSLAIWRRRASAAAPSERVLRLEKVEAFKIRTACSSGNRRDSLSVGSHKKTNADYSGGSIRLSQYPPPAGYWATGICSRLYRS